MNRFATKALSASAAVATLSVMAVAVIQPAHAITVTRSNAPATPSAVYKYTTQTLNFSDLPVGSFISQTYFPGTDDEATLSTANGNVFVDSDNGNTLLLLGFNSNTTLEFSFANPLVYFGVRMLNPDLPGSIRFFGTGGEQIGSAISFASVVGDGNYFNFNAPLISERFTRVAITGSLVALDDVAYRVPTPALLPGLVGMGAAALRKRKQEEEEAL